MSDQDKGQGRTGPSAPASTREQRSSKSPGRGSRTSSQYSGVPAPETTAPAGAAAPPPSESSAPPAGGGAAGGEDQGSSTEAVSAFDAAFDLGGVAPVAKPRIDREDDELEDRGEGRPAPGAKNRAVADGQVPVESLDQGDDEEA